MSCFWCLLPAASCSCSHVLNGIIADFLLLEIRIWPPFISVLLAMEEVHKISYTWGKNQNIVYSANVQRSEALLVHCYFLIALRTGVSKY